MTVSDTLEQLVPGLLAIYGDLIDRIVLYGSTARGTHTDESDVDIAVIMRSDATKEMHNRMLDLVVDLELSCGKVLSVLRIDLQRFSEWQDTLPFYKNIRKDGVVLWQAAKKSLRLTALPARKTSTPLRERMQKPPFPTRQFSLHL